MHHDSTSTLTLTSRAVTLEYTDLGREKIRERMDSTTAGYKDAQMARLARASVDGAFRNMRVTYDVRSILSVAATGATVVVKFNPGRSARAARSDDTFDFDATDSASVRLFADRLNALLLARR